METRQLRYFVAVAEELHFGRAAKRLHISQPPLSQQIMKFEEELGVQLLQRTNRQVRLTPEGKLLLQEAREILATIERVRIQVQAVSQGKGGRFTLGYIGPALDTSLAEIIKQFKQACAGVQFELIEMSTNAQLEALHQGTLDAGVVRLFKHETKGLICRTYHEDVYVLALPAGHRLAKKEGVGIEELAAEDFIFFPRDSQPHLYDEWMRIFASAGFTPRIVQEALTKAASLSLVAASMGVAIVPANIRRRAPPQVVFTTLLGEQPTVEVQIAFQAHSHHPVRDHFLAIAQQVSGCSFADEE